MASTTWVEPKTFQAPLDFNPANYPQLFDSFWMPGSLALETQTITRALQVSISHGSSPATSCEPSPAPSVGLSSTLPFRTDLFAGSDTDSGSGRRKRPAPTPPSGSTRVSKRRPRASKRAPVTYIEVTLADFRNMVQQVTGVQGHEPELMDPAPAPARSSAAVLNGVLPTLDTSAFLIDAAACGEPATFGGGELEGLPTLDSWAWDTLGDLGC